LEVQITTEKFKGKRTRKTNEKNKPGESERKSTKRKQVRI